MGLTSGSTGIKAVDMGLVVKKQTEDDKVIALAGNPNVGKSTVFNALTGMNQHTGNWPGKTVTNAQGYCTYNDRHFVMVDIPGCYSLMAHSAEEEVARDFVCFGNPDAVVVVCDATCLERNMNLVLQTVEITPNVVVCVNLMDEAERKGIRLDLDQVAQRLGVPVIPAAARSGKGLDELMQAVCDRLDEEEKGETIQIRYIRPIEDAIATLQPAVETVCGETVNARWLALKLLDYDASLIHALNESLGFDVTGDALVQEKLEEAKQIMQSRGISLEELRDKIVSCIVLTAEDICNDVVHHERTKREIRDRKIDRILTSKWTGFPIMLLLLGIIFWLTITGANYPSQLLSDGLFWIQDRLMDLFVMMGAPVWLRSMLVEGVYRVLAWVVSVMLPPMAIFFPLFTLLEDLGYLPRVAFNLDKYFKKARACGKQALTMCMGFGCNAAGIVGCRIIDSPRERLIAMITNNFVPCNGRYPTLIAIITMFFIGTAGMGASFLSTLILTGVIVLGIVMTFLVSRLLSATILKGVPSSFTLELPPYRRPQIGKVIVRSIFDRTLFVLGRAAAVAAPAGLIIWVMANVFVGDASLLAHCAAFLDPFAQLIGLDGVILLAFILGFPANEIVVPIIIMAYMATGSLTDMSDLTQLHTLLVNNGWTWLTAVCTMLFSLMHWPCSTTCMTIKKETQSLKWTLISFAVPTGIGIIVCFLVASAARLFGLV
ncbi:ferrous iron transport protein B [Anaeromassilibacillus senegalensis]|uniref:ferrous iron transport protein B n=1 Tax=Anaeromassilibacillus senegalensis TaxID=1673717 RepID=UPI0006805959|nr:ferrous iron transport protein B [Anaeromassilibacillus senegalensis]